MPTSETFLTAAANFSGSLDTDLIATPSSEFARHKLPEVSDLLCPLEVQPHPSCPSHRRTSSSVEEGQFVTVKHRRHLDRSVADTDCNFANFRGEEPLKLCKLLGKLLLFNERRALCWLADLSISLEAKAIQVASPILHSWSAGGTCKLLMGCLFSCFTPPLQSS